jgi:prefoldin subunit 5
MYCESENLFEDLPCSMLVPVGKGQNVEGKIKNVGHKDYVDRLHGS